MFIDAFNNLRDESNRFAALSSGKGHFPIMANGFSFSKACSRDSSSLQIEVFLLLEGL